MRMDIYRRERTLIRHIYNGDLIEDELRFDERIDDEKNYLLTRDLYVAT